MGLIAYLLFAASHPFIDKRFIFDYKEMVLEPYKPLESIESALLPGDLENFIHDLLAVNPDDRFQSTSEALAELDHIEEQYCKNLLDAVLEYYDLLKSGKPITDSISQAELAKGISLCKLKGLYPHGAFLYENAGGDYMDIHEEARSILENDYIVCKRRAGREVTL